MKKLFGIFTAFSLAVITSLTGIPVSAANGITLTDQNFRKIADFDTAPSTYAEGAKPGSPTDRVGLSKNKKCISGDHVGIAYDMTIMSGIGVSGKALKIAVTNASEGGDYSPLAFHIEYSKQKAQFENVEGATDFIFWVDNTKDYVAGKPKAREFSLTIQEVDCDKSGKLLKTATAWCTKPKEDGGYILYQDSKGNWIKYDTCLRSKGRADIMGLPKQYKGWIKVPISCLRKNDWNNNNDVDGKFDGKQIQYVSFGLGYYANESKSEIVFDEVGFLGNFKKAPSSSVTPSSSKTNLAVSKTASSGSNSSTVSASSSAASSNTVSSDVSSGSSSESNIASSESASSSVTQADTKPSPFSIWLIIAIIIAVCAVGVGVFFIIKKIKKV